MEVREKMFSLGWHISVAGFALLDSSDPVNGYNAPSKAMDIRDFGEPVLSSLLKQCKTDKIILQIQKIRNVASPKSKEDSQFAPRMLKLILTDGHTTCQAVEVTNISFLSRTNTPPGSKLLINGAKISSGCILLHPKCCDLLGGRVPALCEKWELVKNISQNIRSAGKDGPPPWVNFGEKVLTPALNEPFKALADKTTKEATNEFDLHRQDAISSAATGAVKKVFGGGAKQAPQFNNAINQQKRFNNQEFNKNRPARGFKGKSDSREKVDKPQKPQEKVSLFDFLEDKLPISETDDKSSFKKYIQRDTTKSNNFVQINNFNTFPPAQYDTKPIRHPPRFERPVKSAYTNNHSNTPTSSLVNFVVPKNTQRETEHKISKSSINEVSRNMSKLSLDTQFAAKTFKQHLNLFPNAKSNDTFSNNDANSTYNWKVGDLCMAKYWENGKYYNASVTNITQNTCVVSFNGYGNVEEVLKVDCIPLDMDDQPSSNMSNNSNYKDYKGGREYRSNRRNYNNRPISGGNQYYGS